MSSIISYPLTFLARPCDRDLLSRLEECGCPSDSAELLLYRIWKDFASGGSDRRPLSEASASDRTVQLLEKFCQWEKVSSEPGLLVTLAIASDFLAIEPGLGGDVLVCRDFYPINSKFAAGGKSMQRKGALSQVLNREVRKADEASGRHLELWERAPQTEFEQWSGDVREQALVFIHSLCNCAGKPVPSDAVLKGGLFGKAVKCVQETAERERKDTLLYIISLRKDPALPADLAGLLHSWPNLVVQAQREGV